MHLAHCPNVKKVRQRSIHELGRYFKLPQTPEKILERAAADLFDRGHRIYIVPHDVPIMPEDEYGGFRFWYSFTCDDWHRHIYVTPQEKKELLAKNTPKPMRVYAVWDEVITYALAQSGMSRNALNKDKSINSRADFYRFVVPEVHYTEAIAPGSGEPFHLHRNNYSGQLFFIEHAPQPGNKKGKKK